MTGPKSRDGWMIFDNTENCTITISIYGKYDAMAHNEKKVRNCEDHFADPMDPTDDEWVLFILEFGTGLTEYELIDVTGEIVDVIT